jgi:hypothetical protein
MAVARVAAPGRTKFFISESLSSSGDANLADPDAVWADRGGPPPPVVGAAAAPEAVLADTDVDTAAPHHLPAHRARTASVGSGGPGGDDSAGTSSMMDDDGAVPTGLVAPRPGAPLKQSPDGLFCKVHVGPVAPPPPSLLSEQLKRSPPMDLRVPLLPPLPRRTSAPSPRRTAPEPLPRLVRPPLPLPPPPALLLEGTESLRRHLLQERNAAAGAYPADAADSRGDAGVFSYRSRVTGW